MEMTPEKLKQIRSKMGKRSSSRGADYEREVAKKICNYFGENSKEWEKHFRRTKRTKGGQPEGDIVPRGRILEEWNYAELGPIEAKNRIEWSLMELFKNPKGSKLYNYWLKSNEDTYSNNSIVCFTKPYAPDLVFYNEEEIRFSSFFSNIIDEKVFLVVTLKDFLINHFPQYSSN